MNTTSKEISDVGWNKIRDQLTFYDKIEDEIWTYNRFDSIVTLSMCDLIYREIHNKVKFDVKYKIYNQIIRDFI